MKKIIFIVITTTLVFWSMVFVSCEEILDSYELKEIEVEVVDQTWVRIQIGSGESYSSNDYFLVSENPNMTNAKKYKNEAHEVKSGWYIKTEYYVIVNLEKSATKFYVQYVFEDPDDVYHSGTVYSKITQFTTGSNN